MPEALDQAAAVAFSVAAATWIGGLVTVIVVVRAARVSLTPQDRVRFFRAMGRGYLTVLGTSFLVAVTTGGWLLRAQPWDAAMMALVLTIAALTLASGTGIAQARSMTRLRRRALNSPADPELADRVDAGARRTLLLRAAIAVLTLAGVILGVMVTME